MHDIKIDGVILKKHWLRQELAKPFQGALKRTVSNDKEYGSYIIPGLYFDKNGYEYVLFIFIFVNL